MFDPEELSSCLAYKECGVSNRNVSLLMSPLARLINPVFWGNSGKGCIVVSIAEYSLKARFPLGDNRLHFILVVE
mgnify:CR=1 FL=1